MNQERLRQLLQAVAGGEVTADDAAQRLRHLACEDIGYANIDHHRSLRKGFPEVIFGEGKSAEQIAGIMERMSAQEQVILATRVDALKAQAVLSRFPQAHYHADARMIVWEKASAPVQGRGTILVLAAGTSDIPVAMEAVLTAQAMGNRVEKVIDVGVAGIHRLFRHRELIEHAVRYRRMFGGAMRTHALIAFAPVGLFIIKWPNVFFARTKTTSIFKDKTTADAICATLEANGIRVWIAPRDVMPGSDWGESIIEAIEQSKVMILVFSTNSNSSPQIKREIERSVNKGVTVVPFRIDDIMPSKTLEYFISTQHWLDAFTPPLEKHLDNLVSILRSIITKQGGGGAAPKLKPPPPEEKEDEAPEHQAPPATPATPRSYPPRQPRGGSPGQSRTQAAGEKVRPRGTGRRCSPA